MAKVKLLGTSLSKTFSKQLSGRILADLVGVGRKNPTLTNQYDKAVQKISTNLSNGLGEKINQQVGLSYNSAITEVQKFLKEGHASKFNPAWSNLGRKYARRKIFRGYVGAGKFWLNRGGLSEAFDSLAFSHKREVSNMKHKLFLGKAQKKFRQKRFRFRLDFTLPPLDNPFLNAIFQESFFSGVPRQLTGTGLSGNLRIIGFLEGVSKGASSRHRPFIAQLMASRGQDFNTTVGRIIKTQGF